MRKTPIHIFEDARFDIDIVGIERVKSSSQRWRKSYNDKGVLGLNDTRTLNSGRTLNRELTLEEILAKKDAEIEYLKAELELVKKLEVSERQVKNNKLTTFKIFELIYGLISKFNLKGMTKQLCKISYVSTSGFYRSLNTQTHRNTKENKDLKSRYIILKAFNHGIYKKGSRSIKMTLKNEFGVIMNRKKIQRIMRKYNIICPIRKSNPYKPKVA